MIRILYFFFSWNTEDQEFRLIVFFCDAWNGGLVSRGHLVELLTTLIDNASQDLLAKKEKHWYRTCALLVYWIISKEPSGHISEHLVKLEEYFLGSSDVTWLRYMSAYSRQKFSGLSWMVKRYYIQDYPEYFGSVLTG